MPVGIESSADNNGVHSMTWFCRLRLPDQEPGGIRVTGTTNHVHGRAVRVVHPSVRSEHDLNNLNAG